MLRDQNPTLNCHLASAHHCTSFPIPLLSCSWCDELQPVTPRYVTQSKQDKTHTNCHANMCLPMFFSARKCNWRVPHRKARGWGTAPGCVRQTCPWHTVSTQIHSSQPAAAVMKAPPAVITFCSFRKKKKKKAAVAFVMSWSKIQIRNNSSSLCSDLELLLWLARFWLCMCKCNTHLCTRTRAYCETYEYILHIYYVAFNCSLLDHMWAFWS